MSVRTDYERTLLARAARALLPASTHPLARRVRRDVGAALRSRRYRGSAYACPCCGGTFRRFLDFHERPNAQCPRCLSLERHRHLCLLLERRAELLANARVLHLAPEDAVRRFLARRALASYVTADLEAADVDVLADLTALPFEGGAFDLVVCSHVLEHVHDDAAALRELHRILRAGGHALVLVPIEHDRAATFEPPLATPEERALSLGQWDHVRAYGTDFPERPRAVGFDVDIVDLVRELEPREVERLRLRHVGRWGPDEIFICTKPAATRMAAQ